MGQSKILSTGVSAIPTDFECVNSIAELRALTAGVVPCLTVLGYYAQGDGGGGRFYWDASDSQPDDGGTIIAPASTPPNQAGRWKRLVATPVSPKWWGAKGDGVTVDTNALKAALLFAQTHGASVHFPDGNYLLDDTLFYNPAGPGLPIRLYGENGTDSNAKITWVGPNGGVMLRMQNATLSCSTICSSTASISAVERGMRACVCGSAYRTAVTAPVMKWWCIAACS